MGDLARHVAELGRRRHPACAVPGDLTGQFGEMARLAVASARRMQDIIAAPMQDRADDRIDELHREILNTVNGVAWAVRCAMAWTWRCWPGSSNASPTRPYRSPAGGTTSSPELCPAEVPGEDIPARKSE